MSEHKIEVVRLGPVEKHPNADTLAVTMVHGGYPAIVRLGEFHEGDLAVYLPIDSLVPVADPRFAFLASKAHADGRARIKAAKLRGIFSMGLLVPAQEGWQEGQDVAAALGVGKWEPQPDTSGESAPTPSGMVPYYDPDGLRRYPVLVVGEEVEITEKLHGANARYLHDGATFHVGSHGNWKADNATSTWWKAARRYDLAAKLATRPGLAFYGEVYGAVQDFKYGCDPGEIRLAVFDVWDTGTGRWLDADDRHALCFALDIPEVPMLFRGPWDPALVSLAEGPSTVPGAPHVREGIVVRTVKERAAIWLHTAPDGSRFEEAIRCVLKYIGEGYMTRKEKR